MSRIVCANVRGLVLHSAKSVGGNRKSVTGLITHLRHRMVLTCEVKVLIVQVLTRSGQLCLLLQI